MVAHLQAGRSVVVHTNPATRMADGAVVSAPVLGAALAQVVQAAIGQAGVRRLLVAGGDTASHTARSLGIEAMEMIAPLAPGAPLCRVRAPGCPADRNNFV